MALYVKNFSAGFAGHQILKTVTLRFKKNQINVIVGPSGCGKTTLLKSINRTAEMEKGFSFSGEIRLGKENIYANQDPSVIRRKIGLVFQTPVALPLSIKENVLFGPRYFGRRDKPKLATVTEHCLQRAGLWAEVKDKLDLPARTLSGGQKQRLAIARVLAVEPEVLLLDEPCSSLDPASTKLIEALLLDLAGQLTIVLVTHNLFQANRVAHKVIFLMDGQVIESGSRDQMFSHPEQAKTKAFFSGLL